MIARTVYRGATALAAPLIARYLAQRLADGKEDRERFAERQGIPGLDRPDGPLVWLHAASNGEAMSALPLIDRLLARDTAGHVLLTTGTVTSARLMADRLPMRAMHQFVPVDRTPWVSAFLSHWRPDAGIWVESEFWPALIWEMRRIGRPMALVNGRVSPRSLARWRRIPGIASDLLAGFNPCLAQTEEEAVRLRDIGAPEADCVGNLKLSAAPLAVDPDALAVERSRTEGRPIWLAASTHPGEEEIAADAHGRIVADHPGLLTVIVPRHPRRGAAIAEMLRARGLTVAQRSQGGMVDGSSDVLLADTLGELGLFFRLAPVALIGGSLRGGHGGHNPIEAARLGCAPLHGPDMANFKSVAADLSARSGAEEVADAAALGAAVSRLLKDEAARGAMVAAAAAVADEGAGAADRVLARLSPILPPVRGGD